MKFLIQETDKSPLVDFDPSKSKFLIKGSLTPENPIEFYSPIIKWMNTYAFNPNTLSIFTFQISNIDSESIKQLFLILSVLENINENSGRIKIVWKYQNGDQFIENKGKELDSFIEIPFLFEEV